MFNLFGQLTTELNDFYNTRVHLGGDQTGLDYQTGYATRPLSRRSRSYSYSQSDTLNLIDLYYNSKFVTGPLDSEGQRKVFLNICQFRSDVGSKMVDLDTKDFIFVPTENSSQWPAWFLSKEFKQWAKDKKFGKLINEVVNDYPKYGSVVVKVVGDDLFRVPLNKLINTQDAESLQTADYVIEKHIYTYQQLKNEAKARGWDMNGIQVTPQNYNQKITVYERYADVPESMVKENGDPDKMVKAVSIMTYYPSNTKTNPEMTGNLLFIKQIKELPYREVHWRRQDGRWLGVGEIENQFENQLSRNVLANLRRRALLWSSKKIFQSTDDGIAKNIIRDVKDGDVLRVAPNGGVSQVDMTTRTLAEFNADEKVWEENSNQKAFTFEITTGESLPSGTPFRLGVMMSQAVRSYFELKRENLGFFFKELIGDFVIPTFKKQSKAHTVNIFGNEAGIEDLRTAMTTMYTNMAIKEEILNNGFLPNPDLIRAEVAAVINSRPYLFVDIPDQFYDDLKYRVDIIITGEQMDVLAKIETFKSLLQVIAANPNILLDPNAREILKRIMGLTGESLESLVGRIAPPAPGIPPPAQPIAPGRLPIRGRGVRGARPLEERLSVQSATEETVL